MNPRTLVQIFLCALGLCVLYYETFESLVRDWINLPDFSHGFFIPLVSLYFIWERRAKIQQLEVSPRSSGLVLLVFGLCIFVLGNLASENFTARFSFLIVLAGIIHFCLGWDHLKVLSFPIGILIFMIPIPSILLQKVTFPMQLFASNVAEFSLQQLGIPVLREGNVIQLANTTLEVAEACSGIRSLISLLALGTVFAYFAKDYFWEKVLLIASVFPIAIIINALRVSATGVLANYYGISAAEGFFHGFSGYILFLIAFGLLLAVSYLLSRLSPKH